MIIGMSEEESEMLDKKTFDDAVLNVQVMLLMIHRPTRRDLAGAMRMNIMARVIVR